VFLLIRPQKSDRSVFGARAACSGCPAGTTATLALSRLIASSQKIILQLYIDVVPYRVSILRLRFEWDTEKEKANLTKHGVDFSEATAAFYDPKHLISADEGHSAEETRLFCIGRTARGILMVRFTYRSETVRIIGAGYWRKGRRLYEKENPIES
jgi:uncharacterized DUF497 family protein